MDINKISLFKIGEKVNYFTENFDEETVIAAVSFAESNHYIVEHKSGWPGKKDSSYVGDLDINKRYFYAKYPDNLRAIKEESKPTTEDSEVGIPGIDPNVFPKGAYVVFLHGPGINPNPWENIMPINHCYRLRLDSDTFNFHVEKDLSGSTSNGWSKPYNSDGSNYMALRLATHKEISEYERLGGNPFNVTTLSKEEIVNDYSIF